jgi:FkbH-like protein
VGTASLDRIVQLIAKTNQFKLNPRIFSTDEIAEKAEGVFAVRFKDRMQDYGITAVAVAEMERDEVIVLNWVMSCRVFSRRLEHATLELIRGFAQTKGAKRIRALFQASPKNDVARGALIDLGFAPDEGGDFVAPVVPDTSLLPHFIRIECEESQ